MVSKVSDLFTIFTLVFTLCVFEIATKQTAYVVLDDNLNPYITTSVSSADWVVEGSFSDKVEDQGLSVFTATSNPAFRDAIQAYSAGFLEGNLTASKIDQMFKNIGTYDLIVSGNIRDFIWNNYNYMKQNIDSKPDDTYWYQAGLVWFQIKGMEDGFLGKPGNVSNNIDPLGLFWLYNWQTVELTDLQMKYAEINPLLGSGHCSALIKNTGSDLLTSHVTWTEYSWMVRIMRKLNLPFRSSEKYGNTIAGSSIAESSYPGMVQSIDDFYITNQKLVVMETTNLILNSTLYDRLTPYGTVPYFIRAVVATRLSSTGQEWIDYFSKYNSGTYNNQWMVVDYKKYSPNQTIAPGTLYVLEQLPGFITYEDMSYVLNTGTNAWVSYNSPYFQETIDIDNITATIDVYGDFFSHDSCPRAKMFARDVDKAVDVNSTISLMRYNDFRNDPYAKCQCDPLGYSGENGISARSDLNPVNGEYFIGSEGARCHGGIDVKITNMQMVDSMQMTVVMGPTYDQQPVFDWSRQNRTACKNVRHEGHPTRFEFLPVLIDFENWNDRNCL